VRLLLKQKKISKMIGNFLRKFIVVLIIIAPMISYSGCKKQTRCGCGNDVLITLTGSSAYVYWSTSSNIYFQLVGDPYSTYYFCNPSEMYPKLSDAKSGDILQLSGHVYWDCNYVYQSSNSPYQSPYKVYQCQVTDLTLDLYGKSKPSTTTAIQKN
jgi:hypothetical protein